MQIITKRRTFNHESPKSDENKAHLESEINIILSGITCAVFDQKRNSFASNLKYTYYTN